MNLQLLVAVISRISFEFRFPVNFDNEQNFLYLEGLDQNAHLFRKNATVYLQLSHGYNYSLYAVNVSQPSFTFTWTDVSIDGKVMLLQSSIGEISEFQYENFTLFSPELVDQHHYTPTCPQCILNVDSVNYWYIVLIVLLVGLLIDSKGFGLNFARSTLSFMQQRLNQRIPNDGIRVDST